jgi:hypothetical protein
MWATCPLSASCGYHAEFHVGCYQKHTNGMAGNGMGAAWHVLISLYSAAQCPTTVFVSVLLSSGINEYLGQWHKQYSKIGLKMYVGTAVHAGRFQHLLFCVCSRKYQSSRILHDYPFHIITCSPSIANWICPGCQRYPSNNPYTWCDNLIPGMALWKQNLLAGALTSAVAFEILSLWSYEFVRRWCHCWKQFWKSFFGIPRSNVFTFYLMSKRSANLCPFRAVFNFGKI